MHGEWTEWCESIGIDRSNANKFIRVFDELDVVTLPRLGIEALYQIATVPRDTISSELRRYTKSQPCPKPNAHSRTQSLLRKKRKRSTK